MNGLLSAAVGEGQVNMASDVKVVQSLLNRNLPFWGAFPLLKEDGRFGTRTQDAIKAVQARVLGQKNATGVIQPNDILVSLLCHHVAPAKQTTVPSDVKTKGKLTEAQYIEAAKSLGCEPAAIKAVAETETKRAAFDEKGRPTILFERHKFSEFTNGKYDAIDPNISNRTSGGYGPYRAQYDRLEKAKKLDEEAALKSASWGAFQLMGFNFRQCGFSSIGAFVAAMQQSEARHLEAFVAFIRSNEALTRALRGKNWATFAKKYNGSEYKKNNYDVKMSQNYDNILRGAG